MLYSDIVNLSAGTTVDVFGTSGTIALSANARRLVGIGNVGVDPTFTTAEGAASIVRVQSASLNMTDVRYEFGPYTTSGPATNSSGQCMIPEYLPLDIPCGGSEVVTIDIAPTATITTARLHTVQLLYVDDTTVNPALNIRGEPYGGLPSDWKANYPDVLPSLGGYAIDASQLTTTATDLAAINLPSWMREIIALKATMLKTGAVTTAEEVLGYFGLKSSIPNITPNNWVTNGLGATLGTPVGTGLYHEFIPYTPIFMKGTGKAETLTPTVNLRTAVTTANRVQFAVLWR